MLSEETRLNDECLNFAFNGIGLRVVRDEDGQPWFVASDVAYALEYRMASDMARSLDDDERGTQIVRTPSGDQTMLVINESGLYHAILMSRKSEAKAFKKWVTSEVLPSIRRTGSYTANPINPSKLSRLQLIELALIAEQERIALEEKVQVLEPKAAALERIAEAEGNMNITQAAKTLQMPPKRLFTWLSRNGWIYRRPGGSEWVAYQPKIVAGYMEHKVVEIGRSDGDPPKIVTQAQVTPKGIARLGELLGVEPQAA